MNKLFSSRRSAQNPGSPVIETLEERRLLSADLTGVFANQMPDLLQVADRNHAAVRVVNDTGEKFKGPVTVDLFADSPVSGDNDVLLGSVTRKENLRNDGSSLFNFRFAQPASLPDGSYSLVAQISSSKVTNPTPTDSIVTAPSPIRIQQPYTDVTAKSVKGPTESVYILNGAERTEPASITVLNQGTEKATGTISISLLLSTHSTLDSVAFPAGGLSSTVNLKPGASQTFTAQIDAPISTPTGMYYLFAVVKPTSGFVQTNPAHEVAISPTQVSVENTQIVPSQVPTNTGTPTNGAIGQATLTPTTTGSSNGTTSTGSTDTGCDTGDTGTDDSSCDNGNGDGSCDSGSSDSSCDSGADSSTDTGSDDSGTDQSTDAGADQSTDTGSDNSTDTSTDTGSDDSSDTGSDDSSDDSGSDDSTDDGDDEGDDIARRSKTSELKPVHTTKPVLHAATSTTIHTVVYNKAGNTTSGGHK